MMTILMGFRKLVSKVYRSMEMEVAEIYFPQWTRRSIFKNYALY